MKISNMIELINTYEDSSSLKVFVLSVENGMVVYHTMQANNRLDAVYLDAYSEHFDQFQRLETAEDLIKCLQFCMEDNGDRNVYNRFTVQPVQFISLKDTDNGKALLFY